MPKIKVTIHHMTEPLEGERYGVTTDVYEQTLDWDWVQVKNPYMIQKIIAVVNGLVVTEKEEK